MRKQNSVDTNIESLMGLLSSKDGMTCQKARKTLESLGKPAVPYLIQALKNSRLDQVRWEAAKALGAIGGIRALPSLVKALDVSNYDVAWLAAEGLRRLKKAAWQPLLRALIKGGADSVLLRRGAHHVFKNQKEDGFNDLLANLMEALESSSVPELTTIAANDILKQMKIDSEFNTLKKRFVAGKITKKNIRRIKLP